VHGHTALRQRQRDPAGADAELERAPLPGECGEEVDGGSDDGRVEQSAAASS